MYHYLLREMCRGLSEISYSQMAMSAICSIYLCSTCSATTANQRVVSLVIGKRKQKGREQWKGAQAYAPHELSIERDRIWVKPVYRG